MSVEVLQKFNVEGGEVPDAFGMPIFDFIHQDNLYTVNCSVDNINDQRKPSTEGHTTFWATNAEGETLCFSSGVIIHEDDGSLSFSARHSGNVKQFYYSREKDNPNYIPNMVGTMIAEIVDREVVNVWESDYAMTNGSRKMYDRLANDPRLNVSHDINYAVTKRLDSPMV